ncbi:hypothetical protein IM060_000431 [Escherichia coli]|uniref:hypothetical protein n=1 Tax=Escherichia coli TaxID=562 RepID=UPI00067BDDA0|nr:hypothetical protein [Escherichia coli]ALL94374.1 hypothetical protein AKK22_17245 [Escherichia coli]EEC9533506.1 hypothetical protein [Escherichia coli]EED0759935.1 hypothetical protein [Escherichia coli]EEQ5364632.1 hypothetical protein [Escherichia coli]EEQ8834969.1 hypothetical protein [Escherichia coli]
MHTPIGVKPVAGSKEWREAWQKRAFAHISNGYKYIYIAINSPEIFLLVCPSSEFNTKIAGKIV